MINNKKLQFLDLRKTFSIIDNPGLEAFKRLDVGMGSGLIAEDQSSWNIKPCRLNIKPQQDVIFLYAMCSRKTEDAELVISNETLVDTQDNYLILIKQSDYQSLTF